MNQCCFDAAHELLWAPALPGSSKDVLQVPDRLALVEARTPEGDTSGRLHLRVADGHVGNTGRTLPFVSPLVNTISAGRGRGLCLFLETRCLRHAW